MFRKGLYLWILGYRRVGVKSERITELLTHLYRRGFKFKYENNNNYIFVCERDISSFKKYISSDLYENISEPLGLFGGVKRIIKRRGVALSLLLVSLLCVLSYNTVMDIRIYCEDEISEDYVINKLEEKGFSVGCLWMNLDIDKIERALLTNSEEISWININRRGNVAYVELILNEEKKEEESYEYSNVVAGCDAVIEEITVNVGYPCVKVGDTVKAGDVLISGVPNTEGGEFCRASGTVKGRVNERFLVSVPKQEKINIEEKIEYNGFSIKIFKNIIKIFKIYRNSTSEYAIIENEKEFALLGRSLPISIIRYYKTTNCSTLVERSNEEMIEEARRRSSDIFANLSQNAEIVSIRSNGEFLDVGYRLINEVVYVSNIGKEIPFELEKG